MAAFAPWVKWRPTCRKYQSRCRFNDVMVILNIDSRISPVRGSETWDRKRFMVDGRYRMQGVARIFGIPIWILRLRTTFFCDDGILEAGCLKMPAANLTIPSLIHLTTLLVASPGRRSRHIVSPVVGKLRIWIFLLQPPTGYVSASRRSLLVTP